MSEFFTEPFLYKGFTLCLGGPIGQYRILFCTPGGRAYISRPFTTITEANATARRCVDVLSSLHSRSHENAA